MVIDTMVFAYGLFSESARGEQALEVLRRVDEVLVPDSIRAELVNTVWQWVRAKRVPLDVGVQCLRDADALFDRVVSGRWLWERALHLAEQAGHPAYDTIFVALAERERTRVVTYDQKLLRAFPELSVAPQDLLLSRR